MSAEVIYDAIPNIADIPGGLRRLADQIEAEKPDMRQATLVTLDADELVEVFGFGADAYLTESYFLLHAGAQELLSMRLRGPASRNARR